MQLERIITLANRPFRLRFLALERSLRATGCDLPLAVIPYDDSRFDLPANSQWWEIPAILSWLALQNITPLMRKYQCLTVGNYQFVDSDVIFLRNPRQVLANQTGFIASCGHWHNPEHTITRQSQAILREKSTSWPRLVFNAGQFACDRALYSEKELIAACTDPGMASTCLFPYADQPGIVLLVNHSGVPIRNLTLPPDNMESTWAGDYPDEKFTSTWNEEKKPYLIHWAGCDMSAPRPIDRLFTDFLTLAEQAEWREQVAAKAARQATQRRTLRHQLRRLKRGIHAFRAAVKE